MFSRHTSQISVAAAAFFSVLCAYYILRPLRDELGVLSGVVNLDWLFSATFVGMVVAMAGYAWLSARVARRRIVIVLFLAVAVSLLLFRLAFAAAPDNVWLPRLLFVWISVINLFLVSGFWSVMTDVFDTEAGARGFGIIAAGGTLGALCGPGLTAYTAQQIAAPDLLLPAAALISLAAGLLTIINRDGASQRIPAAGVSMGLNRLLKIPHLRGLAGMVVMHAVLSTFVYLLMMKLVSEQVTDSAQRIQLFAGMDLSINLIAVAVQVSATASLLKRAGVVICVSVMPVIAAAGFGILSAWPMLYTVIGLNIAMRSARFAVSRPARELLFTWMPAVDRYRSRALLDTLVYRASDVVGAWLVSGLTAIGMGVAAIAATGVPLSLAWWGISAGTAAGISRRQDNAGETTGVQQHEY